MVKVLYIFIFILGFSLFSCGSSSSSASASFGSVSGSSSTLSYNPGKEITRNIKYKVTLNDAKKYKNMQACEEKFLKRFNRLYAKQQKHNTQDEVTTPFFSSNAN